MDIKQQSNEQIKGNECTLVCVESTQQEHGRKDSYEKHSECLLCSGQTIRENVHLMGLDAMPHPTSALFLFAWLKKKALALDPWECLEKCDTLWVVEVKECIKNYRTHFGTSPIAYQLSAHPAAPTEKVLPDDYSNCAVAHYQKRASDECHKCFRPRVKNIGKLLSSQISLINIDVAHKSELANCIWKVPKSKCQRLAFIPSEICSYHFPSRAQPGQMMKRPMRNYTTTTNQALPTIYRIMHLTITKSRL